MPSSILDEDNIDEYGIPQSSLPQSRKRALMEVLERKSKKNRTSPLDPFLKAARWIGRSQDPFTNFYSVVHAAIKEDGVSVNPEDEELEWVDEAKHKDLVRIYNLTSLIVPSLKARMDEFIESPEHLEELCSRMTAALAGARGDDCGSLKEVGLVYAALEVGQQSLMPQIAFKALKDATRGFHHPQLGRLLCPAKYLNDFDANSAEFLQKLQDGRVVVTSQDLPTFLYENSKYDPIEMDSGLCRSGILVWTWRHIFTSPSSATKKTPGPGRTKSGQAKLNGLNHVTARTIAYTAVQVYWFLCDKDDWRVDDGLFNKEEFFHIIIRLFETDPDDDWVKDTLEWWNSQVFSTTPVITTASASSSSDLSVLLAQRRARRNQQIAGEHPLPSPQPSSPRTHINSLTPAPSAPACSPALVHSPAPACSPTSVRSPTPAHSPTSARSPALVHPSTSAHSPVPARSPTPLAVRSPAPEPSPTPEPSPRRRRASNRRRKR